MATSSETSSDEDILNSSDELSSDEDLLGLNEREKPKNTNYFDEIIPRYNEEEFIEHFRISRAVTEHLTELFKNSQYFHYQAGGNGKLAESEQILIYLWFVGHQTASFRDVADRFDVAISTLCHLIKKITLFISNMSPNIIKWPTNEEKADIERHFRQNGFPGVVGAIDGSHVRIDKPTNDPDSYLNRKYFHSIQMQIVCDHRKKIRDLFVGFPGSVHDSRVFRTSPLAETLPVKCGDFYLLGDSGYPCLPNLMTPYKDRGQLTRRQQNFNLQLSKNRYVIEHCFGLLKQKFRQLYHLKLRNIPDMVHFIRACCVLHNMALEDEFVYQEGDENRQENVLFHLELQGDAEEEDRNGTQRRNYVANLLRF